MILAGLCVSALPASGREAVGFDTATSVLEEGRRALGDGDLEKAQRLYAAIGFQSPLWREKVEDLLRYHLLRGSAEEAWRLVQVLRRTGDERAVLNDYERLALFKAKACPLALPAGHEPSGHLLSAATYRLLLSKSLTSASEEPSPGGAHLVAGLSPYLKDIPSTKLLKGRGCRLDKLQNRTKDDWLKAEAAELAEFLKGDKGGLTLEASTELVILNRLLLIAGSLGTRDKSSRTTIEAAAAQRLKELAPTLAWEKMPDADRRLIFRQLFGGGKLVEVPLERRAEASAIALRVLDSETSTAAADWLALVDLLALPVSTRIRVFARLEALGAFPGRSWLLVQLAWARAEKDEPREALALIRRLLLENEEPLGAELEASAVELAASLVAEHRFDLKLQGAIRSALPVRLWRALLEDLQLRLALKGERGEFEHVVKLLSEKAALSPRRLALIELERALARRDLAGFRKRVAQGGDRELTALATELAGRLPELSETEAAGLQVYFSEVASALRKKLKAWDSRWDRLADVIHVLEPSTGEAKQGAQSVRKGTLQMGLARWRRPELTAPPFYLKAPEVLPLHTLIAIPDSIGGRGWKLTIDLP